MELNFLFITAGTLSILVTLWARFQPGLKALSENLAAQQAGEGGQLAESIPNG